MKRVALATLGLVAMAVAPAAAADLGPTRMPTKAPVMAAPMVTNWSGFYVGGHVGYGWGQGDHEITVDGFGFLNNPGRPVDIDGWLAGVQIGYNVQVGNMVYGIEADISGARLKGITYDGGVDDDGYQTKVNWFGTVRGRAGMAFDRALLYATGGLAYGHVKATLGDVDPPGYFDPVTGIASDSGTKFGWTIGAGLEYAFAPNWSAKIEYLYVDLGSMNFNGISTGNGNPVIGSIDTAFHVARFGINYRFGGPVVARY